MRTLYESSHDLEAVQRCSNCRAYWFYRWHEYVTFVSDDDWTVWFTRLTDEEGARLSQAQARPDLSCPEARPGFLEDAQGRRRTGGQPDHPWS